jgi:hypothetical protein
MQGALLDSYESAIKRISKSHGLRHSGGVDVMAMDREDYEAVLRVESIELQNQFRERHGFNVDAERRYVHKGLWNASRSLGRTRIVRVKQMERYVDVDIPETTQMRELEYQHEVHDIIRRLKRRLPPSEYQILHRVAQHEKLTEAWNPDVDGGYRSFTRKVRRLQDQARKILRN